MKKSIIKFIKMALSHSIAWSLVGFLLGIIGVMGMQNSYMSAVQEKSFELQRNQMVLQNLLSEVKNSAEFGKKFDQINARLIKIESYMLEVESIRIYFETEAKMPESIKEKRDLITKIKNGFFNKKELINYIVQQTDHNIAEIATKQFIKISDDEDLDFLVKLAFSRPSLSGADSWLSASFYIKSNINVDNANIFTKAFIKHYKKNPNKAGLLIENSKFVYESWFEKNLLIIRGAINNEYPALIEKIEKIILHDKAVNDNSQ